MQPIKFEQLVIKDEKVESICKCTICLEVFTDPICCDNCENHFCSSCLAQWNQSQPNRRCPLCNVLKEKPAQRILKNFLSALQLHCSNKAYGCSLILNYNDYQKHLLNECEYKLVSCKNPGCKKEVLIKDYQHHDDQCQLKIVECQWCNSQLQRQYRQQHEDQCNHRCIHCEICKEPILFSLLKIHIENCPEKMVCSMFSTQLFKLLKLNCTECEELIKLKDQNNHLNDHCLNFKVECSGCNELLPRHFLVEHENQCPECDIVCKNCDYQLKRKCQIQHTIEQCLQNLKKELKQQKEDSSKQMNELLHEITTLKNGFQHLLYDVSTTKAIKQPTVRFSLTYKHPEIYLLQQNTLAQIQDAFSILKDRFIYVEYDKDIYQNSIIEVSFFFPQITDRFVAFGIADISNLSQKKDYYKLNHLAYLFSANGVIYSSHSQEENGRKKDFKFDMNQKINLIYDPINCRVTADNQSTASSYSIDIPAHVIQMHGKSFYPVVCLRGAGDQVQIVL